MPARSYPVSFRRGVHLPAAGLWLDPRDRRDHAVVSHAHGDHVARHREVVATAATLRIMESRMGALAAPRPLRHGDALECGEAVVSLHPAGHVLGSSQVLVRHQGVRVLYSGDIRVRRSRTPEPIEHVDADLLVVEATFGRPQYVFPPDEEVVAAICDFCVDACDHGMVPVLFGYALGKGQELLACLERTGLHVALHPSLHAVTEVYRSLGVTLPPAGIAGDLDAEPPPRTVLVLPPHLRGSRALRRLSRRRTAYVSGWAVDPGAAWRLGCDAAFPLSDHAGFDDLLTYVERTAARVVYTVYGFAEDLAHQLRRRGVEAHALAARQQLTLAFG